MSNLVRAVLAVALCLPASASLGASVDVAVDLLPGDYLVALPSPDGARLAVIGGPGVAGREHTVVVVDLPCEGGEPRTATLSRSAPFAATPEDVPREFVILQWSADGTKLFAAGSVYGMSESEGALAGTKLFTIERPVFDFRFGQGETAAGVEFVAKGRRTFKGGEKFIIELQYTLYRLNHRLAQPIDPREKNGTLWAPVDWHDPPAVSWEPDGKLLIFYPYHAVTERYEPLKVREEVEDARPVPRAEWGKGPFKTEGGCRRTWRLVKEGTAVLVRIETR